MTMTPGINRMTSRCRPTTAASGPTVAAGTVRAWVDLAAARGVRRSALLERSQLDLHALEDQDQRVPLVKLVSLIRAAKELSNDPALALHFGETIDCADYSVASMLSYACETVADALAQRNRYGRLMADVECDHPDRYLLERNQRNDGTVWLIDTRKNPNEIPELTEAFFARVAWASHQQGQTPFLRAAHFTHAEPAYRAEYDRIFRVPLVFESNKNALLMDAAWLQQRIALAPGYVFGILSAHAEALLASLDGSKTFRGRVESLLMPILHTGDASIETIAGKLGLSRQTLFRRLRAEGVTFERVLDELRHTLALHYLRGKKVSVNETAYLVGFSDPAAFSRAFKRWTGSRPHWLSQVPRADESAAAHAEPPSR